MPTLSVLGMQDTFTLGTLAMLEHSKQSACSAMGNGVCPNSLSDLGNPTYYIHHDPPCGAVFAAFVPAHVADVGNK